MDAFDYQVQFDDALEQAFAARDSAVRRAYLDLANFYREKLEERAQMRRAGEIIRSLRVRRSAAAA
jgi:hypothetical protein